MSHSTLARCQGDFNRRNGRFQRGQPSTLQGADGVEQLVAALAGAVEAGGHVELARDGVDHADGARLGRGLDEAGEDAGALGPGDARGDGARVTQKGQKASLSARIGEERRSGGGGAALGSGRSGARIGEERRSGQREAALGSTGGYVVWVQVCSVKWDEMA